VGLPLRKAAGSWPTPKLNRKSGVTQQENFCLSVILFAFPVVDRRTADPSASLGMTNRKEQQLIERGLQTEAFGRVNFDRSAEA
jgi:hypothetical protein